MKRHIQQRNNSLGIVSDELKKSGDLERLAEKLSAIGSFALLL